MEAQGYILEGTDDEYLFVVRSKDKDLLCTLAKRMSRMRDERLKELGRGMEKQLNDKRR